MLARQLDYRLANVGQPGDVMVGYAITKNDKRVLAGYLHMRSGYGGAALARLFKVPRSTAYGWLAWFECLPEGLRAGLLAFMDAQAPILAPLSGACARVAGMAIPEAARKVVSSPGTAERTNILEPRPTSPLTAGVLFPCHSSSPATGHHSIVGRIA